VGNPLLSGSGDEVEPEYSAARWYTACCGGCMLAQPCTLMYSGHVVPDSTRAWQMVDRFAKGMYRKRSAADAGGGGGGRGEGSRVSAEPNVGREESSRDIQ
jgi:hypothetical protein